MPSLLDAYPKQDWGPITFAEPSEWQMIDLAGRAMLLAAVVVGGLMLLLASRNFYRARLLRLKSVNEVGATRIPLSTATLIRNRGGSMNPLTWKREHQIAFLCAIALGCLVGIIAGTLMIQPRGRFEFGVLCSGGEYGPCGIYVPLGYLLLLALWAALGGLIGAVVVYIRQLLRT
jgi:hypothetical protein